MNIAALVSGGVDSSVVVHQLKEMGYEPTIFYIQIGIFLSNIKKNPARVSNSYRISLNVLKIISAFQVEFL